MIIKKSGATDERTERNIETAMAIAISAMFVLTLGVFRIPASIPIFFIAYRRGPFVALASGFAVGLMVLLVKPLYLHPVVFAEAPLEYMAVAVSGFFRPGEKIFQSKTAQWFFDRRGIFIGGFLRFAITLAGSYIIYSYYFQTGGLFIWAIALMDEAPLFIPYLLLTLFLVPMLVKHDFQVHELK